MNLKPEKREEMWPFLQLDQFSGFSPSLIGVHTSRLKYIISISTRIFNLKYEQMNIKCKHEREVWTFQGNNVVLFKGCECAEKILR